MADNADPFPDLDAAALERAEAALANLATRYLEWAEADLVKLEAALAAGRFDQMFGIAHDMKGQGATFAYPLVSELGNRLCRLVETAPTPDAAQLARMAALVAAMGEIIRGRFSGDGGDMGRRLLAL
ncbi:peptide ABC transporter substrate-binding protein [Paramagnetospirillum kuznetsovii]|uniref:Peptide ABC transporter substrate-binding protein n=1 Tax=Paramagnetospirillum kuznetsovii TaxID=2053833 RepID=A0A364P1I0_9PROT|nr:Hpt domain-containing protein [Paramagnetospirillum kuznetsovii]RAU22975.1 peptide ABC transporter substrate-binding protein [Paramagnetospirillum kuznetsovii]